VIIQESSTIGSRLVQNKRMMLLSASVQFAPFWNGLLHAQHGSIYIEAPIFGRPEAAVAQKLWIPFAGPQSAKERVRPLLQAMGGQGLFDFGEEVGAATLVKLVGNFLIGSAAHSLREALSMAEKNGVDPKAVVDMLKKR
jgi:3-hydroxyisobutyrate dehydrogenase-like beta-hydroxyacid dehydrogenase